MGQLNPEQLKPYAKKYIWWKTPVEAIRQPERVISQVMDIGDYEDTLSLRKLIGDDVLRGVLSHAEAGWFNVRSWHYWHYKLGLSGLDNVPELPTRNFA